MIESFVEKNGAVLLLTLELTVIVTECGANITSACKSRVGLPCAAHSIQTSLRNTFQNLLKNIEAEMYVEYLQNVTGESVFNDVISLKEFQLSVKRVVKWLKKRGKSRILRV